jgi:hypothetical protein
MHGTHGDLARGHGHLREELGHRGQEAFERSGGHGSPHQPLDDRGIGGVKGRQIGIGLPFFTQSCHLPSPFVGAIEPVEAIALRGEGGHQGAARLRPAVPADAETETEGISLHLPYHHAVDPLTLGECGVDSLERFVAQRAQSCTVCAPRLDDLRMHPRFGSDEQEAPRVLDAAPRVPVERATIREPQTGAPRGRRRQKRLCLGRVGAQDHRGGSLPQQFHRGLEVACRWLDRFEAPRQDFAPAVMEGKGTPILDDDVAKLCTDSSLGEPEDFQGHLAHETGSSGAHASSKVWLGPLVIERFGGNGRVKQRMEAAMEIGQGVDAMAGTGRRQCQAQTKRRDDPRTPRKLPVFAAGVAQRFGKHPLELVSHHAKLSMIHLGLLSLFLKQHAQEECRMDHRKNLQQNQILKSTYL